MSQTNGSHLDIELLSALVDGELPAAEMAAAEAHLATCTVCRAERARLERTVHAIQVLPAVRPPRSFRIEPAVAPAPAEQAPRPLPPPTFVQPPPSRVSWLSPGLLRSLAGVAVAVMVVLFIADAFVPSQAVSRTAAVTPAGGAAAAAQQRAREAAPAPAAAPRSASAPPAQLAAPAPSAADNRGIPSESQAAAPSSGAAGGAADRAGTTSGSEAEGGGAEATPAIASAPRALSNAPLPGGAAASNAAPNGATNAGPTASPPAPTVSYSGGGLRPLHLGAAFGGLAFLLIVASTILARRRAAPRRTPAPGLRPDR